MTQYYGQRAPHVHHSLLRVFALLFLSTCLFVTFLAHPQIAHGKGSAVSETQATGLVPIYLFHVVEADGRWQYTMSIEQNFGAGWIADGIVFYAYAQSQADTIPIYRYYSMQGYGAMSYTFS